LPRILPEASFAPDRYEPTPGPEQRKLGVAPIRSNTGRRRAKACIRARRDIIQGARSSGAHVCTRGSHGRTARPDMSSKRGKRRPKKVEQRYLLGASGAQTLTFTWARTAAGGARSRRGTKLLRSGGAGGGAEGERNSQWGSQPRPSSGRVQRGSSAVSGAAGRGRGRGRGRGAGITTPCAVCSDDAVWSVDDAVWIINAAVWRTGDDAGRRADGEDAKACRGYRSWKGAASYRAKYTSPRSARMRGGAGARRQHI